MDSLDHQEAIADLVIATASTEISAGEQLSKSQKKELQKTEKTAAGTLVEKKLLNGKPGASNGATGKKESKFTRPKHAFKSPRGAYRETVSSTDSATDIRMAVIDRRHPEVELDQQQADLLQSKLIAAIDSSVTTDASPKFQRTKYELGILWITCADQLTQDWLLQTVPELQGLWEEASLTVVEDKDLPKRTKFVVWVPDTVDEEVIRSRLGKQNGDLATENWLLMNRKVGEKWQTLTYSVDEQSAKALKQLNFRPYHSLGRVTFKKMGPKYKYRRGQLASQ